MKINTNTIIKNLKGEAFQNQKNGKDVDLTVGDVLFAELNSASGVPLKTSWRLLPALAKENNKIELSEEDKNILLKIISESAEKPAGERFNLVIYGRIMEILS
jgi:hypothetical protein